MCGITVLYVLLSGTKSALGIIAYTALKYYGKSYYKEYIESRYDLATVFAGIISSDSKFELAVVPDSNIVCFRYTPAGPDNNSSIMLNQYQSGTK